MTESTNKDNIGVLKAMNPTTQTLISGEFAVTSSEEIDGTVEAAHEAWKVYKNISGKSKANFLRTIASEIESLGDTLVERAMAESGLPEGRIKGERGRTCNQLRLFATLLDEGSWVNAVIDEAMPGREPMPRVDLRKMSIALGPVAVFTASNFPLAFSTAGGDTASALASGCPVIVKGHPSHLGTNNLVAGAISTAAKKCKLPSGVFSTINGGIEVGQELVTHHLIKAVGFTGSFRGGKAIFDLSNKRTEPIPVYAEMGSNNPIFILQDKIKLESAKLASTIANSVNMGAGQFCTNPGILVMQKSQLTTDFLELLKTEFSKLQPSTMLNEGIYKSYESGKEHCMTSSGVTVLFNSKNDGDEWKGEPGVAVVSASNFLANRSLQEEVFGPFSLAVISDTEEEMLAVATQLQGQLTATVMATDEEVINSSELMEILTQKAGRVIFNGVPTGVEVCYAMHHGGPFPSSSNSLYTSVGTDAIQRFVRPVAFQNMPDALLPEALKHDNPLGIWRTVNGEKIKA